ncbi:MAG: hypothetical protein ACREM9_02215 [Gemmatimonadales bacterium]
MHIRQLDRVAGTATLALVLWQCGGDTEAARSASAPPNRVDACELVPKQEVETIVGASIANASANFSEHTYTKPVSFTASCMYTGAKRAVMLWVDYPNPESRWTSEELASRISEQLRSDAEEEPSIKELYRSTEVRPVAGLAGAAAEYAMLDQTTLEVRAGQYHLKVVAPSSEIARGVAAKALERLE